MINDFLLINDKRLSVYIFYELVYIIYITKISVAFKML